MHAHCAGLSVPAQPSLLHQPQRSAARPLAPAGAARRHASLAYQASQHTDLAVYMCCDSRGLAHPPLSGEGGQACFNSLAGFACELDHCWHKKQSPV